ncbi:hypothetical protein [Alcaligenes sp. WGS1538]|uniref:hypothetical protein n=1 Tax=Alcaligenes sp. WGS1538 TaxID=3366811 RepID=UPI00372D1982
MREGLLGLKRIANRFKLVFAIAALFMSGLLLGIGAQEWRHQQDIGRLHDMYERRIAGLESALQAERNITRGQLDGQAGTIGRIAADMEKLLEIAEKSVKTATRAATTARTAANTAKGAAQSAALSQEKPRAAVNAPREAHRQQWIEP